MKRFLLTTAAATVTAVGFVALYAIESLFELAEKQERADQVRAKAGYDERGLEVRDG